MVLLDKEIAGELMHTYLVVCTQGIISSLSKETAHFNPTQTPATTHRVKKNLVLSKRGNGGYQPAVPKEPLADIKSTSIPGDEHWSITKFL